ncbi:MAG: hypothetical protein HY518_02990 [Candidatus Aenigmarchaeota archaeon]|nr:hypothetical protein [Candidatus Aenigmarchaeota archaeon]
MFLMLFGKKRSEVIGPPASRIPTDEVISYSQQGFTEPEIIDVLRKEGYSPQEVDRAMKDALRSSVRDVGSPYRPMPRQVPSGPAGFQERPVQQPKPTRFEDRLPALEPPGMARPQPQRRRPPLGFEEERMDEDEDVPERFTEENEDLKLPEFFDRPPAPIKRLESPVRGKSQELEEVAESVVEEKFEQVKKRINDMTGKVNQLNMRISELEKKIAGAETARPGELEDMEKKMETYQDSIEKVSTKMESMEKVMKDSLTPMMQSMRMLSDTLKSMKATKPPKY